MTFPPRVFSTARRAGIFVVAKAVPWAVYRPRQCGPWVRLSVAIQVLMHHHLAARQRRSPAYPLNLQAEILKAHRVVAVHAAFELQREDQVPDRGSGRAQKRCPAAPRAP